MQKEFVPTTLPPYDPNHLPDDIFNELNNLDEEDYVRILSNENSMRKFVRTLGYTFKTIEEKEDEEISELIPRGFDIYAD